MVQMNFKRISHIKCASLARAVFLKGFLLMEITHRELSRPRYRPLLSVLVDSGGTECTTLPKLIVDSEVRGTTLRKLIVDSEVRGTTLQKLIRGKKPNVHIENPFSF